MSKPQRYTYSEYDNFMIDDDRGRYYLATDIDPILERVKALEECAELLRSDKAYMRHNPGECDGESWKYPNQPRQCNCEATEWNYLVELTLAALDATEGE